MRPRRHGTLHGTALGKAIEKRFGVRLDGALEHRVEAAMTRVLENSEVESIAELTKVLERRADHDGVVRQLRNAVSIGETFFFRLPRQLSKLSSEAVKHLIAPQRDKAGPRELRVWSAGCSTGEEAYTLGILFRRCAPDFDLKVVASDMNDESLELARQATYRGRSFREVRGPSLYPWLLEDSGNFLVSDQLRQSVTFVHHNLVTQAGAHAHLTGFDVVVCRNVLIYLSARDCQRVIVDLVRRMKPKAILVLSPAEYSAARYAKGFSDLSSGVLLRKAHPAAVQLAARPQASQLLGQRQTRPSLGTLPSGNAVDEVKTRLSDAHRMANQGDTDGAARLLGEIVAATPDNARAYRLMGDLALASGAAARAIEEYRRALFLDRSSVSAELGLGLALQRLGHHEAKRHFRRTLEMTTDIGDEAVLDDGGLQVGVARRLAKDALQKSNGHG
jgi:chemotaxis protein methyltransferase CheR